MTNGPNKPGAGGAGSGGGTRKGAAAGAGGAPPAPAPGLAAQAARATGAKASAQGGAPASPPVRGVQEEAKAASSSSGAEHAPRQSRSRQGSRVRAPPAGAGDDDDDDGPPTSDSGDGDSDDEAESRASASSQRARQRDDSAQQQGELIAALKREAAAEREQLTSMFAQHIARLEAMVLTSNASAQAASVGDERAEPSGAAAAVAAAAEEEEERAAREQKGGSALVVGAEPLSARDLDGDARSQYSSVSSNSYDSARSRFAAPTRQIREPETLTYKDAESAARVEAWEDASERFFAQYRVDVTRAEDQEACLQEAEMWMDFPLRKWWREVAKTKAEEGAPITTWKGMLRELRAHFIPHLHSFASTLNFFDTRQHQGETMNQYMLRASDDATRAASLGETAIVSVVLKGMRHDAHPRAIAEATRAVVNGKIKTLMQLRQFMMHELASDFSRKPQASASGGGSSSSGGGYSQGGGNNNRSRGRGGFGRNAQGKQATRAAAIGHNEEEEESDEEETGGAVTRVAPLQKRESSRAGTFRPRCARCHKNGHTAAECKEPDDRQCWVCGKMGHISLSCSARKGDAPKGASSGSTPSKNA